MEEKENGTNAHVAEAPAETTENLPPSKTKPEPDKKPELARHGVDQTGRYLIIEIPLAFGFWAILGYLQEVGDWVRGLESTRRREAAAKQSGIIKPTEAKKGWGGRFNLFKGNK